MILESLEPGKRNTTNDEERHWLGNGFKDFLGNIPKKHLLNQLYMFLKNYDIDEAVRSIREINHIIFVDNYAEGIETLAEKTNLPLKAIQ